MFIAPIQNHFLSNSCTLYAVASIKRHGKILRVYRGVTNDSSREGI